MAAKKPMKQTAKAAVKKTIVVKEPFNKSTLITSLAEATVISKKQMDTVLRTLAHIIEAHIAKNGPGEFTLPGLVKFKVVKKPARKARKGINPFTGEPMTFAAKPAKKIVKVKPLKKLKDIVA